MTEKNLLELRLRVTMRKRNSAEEPLVMMAGGNEPLIAITFSPLENGSPDLITAELDSTGFEPVELAAMLNALSHAMMDGVRDGGVVASDTRPEDWDYGDADPDGGGK